mmetsp:Transcript_50881/g.105932  ORF Transcript_50881/g.105932 Transcript_50881/m.105932 type:complete len:260 (+) Transcript_50881:71-850(+)
MSRPPATSRKVRRVLVLPALLALFLLCLRATQTARALLGAGAVPFPRSVPPGIWARNLLVARRAKADGTLDGGEAEDEEDVKAPSEKDEVEEATEAKASFDQVSRNKAVDEAASAQTADPVEDAKQEQLKTAQEKEEMKDKGFDKFTEKDTLSQKLLDMAVKIWDGAQKDWDGAQKDLDFARQGLRQAVQNGDEKERKEAREEFKKAKEEFEKAKEEAKRAESKVQTAKEEATKAREELEEAKSTAPLQAHRISSSRAP